MPFSKVKSITKLTDKLKRYDIEVKDTHCFFANDILVHNSNASFTKDIEGKTWVNQRKHTIEPKEGEEHFWWKVAKEGKWIDFIDFVSQQPIYQGKNVTLYGEMCGPGIQGNIYGLKEHRVFAFDIKVGEYFLYFYEFKGLLDQWTGKTGKELKELMVPVLHTGFLKDILKDQDIRSFSNGKSVWGNFLREGIVIRPLVEQYINRFGRLLLKQRSPQYLAGSEN
jgi:hypothetical protein